MCERFRHHFDAVLLAAPLYGEIAWSAPSFPVSVPVTSHLETRSATTEPTVSGPPAHQPHRHIKFSVNLSFKKLQIVVAVNRTAEYLGCCDA